MHHDILGSCMDTHYGGIFRLGVGVAAADVLKAGVPVDHARLVAESSRHLLDHHCWKLARRVSRCCPSSFDRIYFPRRSSGQGRVEVLQHECLLEP